MNTRLRVEGLSLRLPDCALRDVRVEVARGECLCVMGPTGAGKTVLVEAIAGVRKPDSGRVWLDGQELTDLPPWARGIAFVPQDAALFPHLNVADNVAYGLVERRLSADLIGERVAQATDLVGVGHLLHRRPATLSGGESQRVALARALALQAGLLLLDEPFAAVDERNREALGAQVSALQRELGTAVVHVSHSFEEAMAAADRICVLDAGRVAQVATPTDLLRRPSCEFVATFTGARNIIPGDVRKTGSGRFFQVGDLRIPVPGEHEGPARLVIRPEDIRLLPVTSHTLAPGLLPGHIARVTGCGSLLRVDVCTDGVAWSVLAVQREAKAVGLELQPGATVAVDLPRDAIHLIP
jgi:molybdate/tungstate transport system ATP-binding protein